jgi:hypothetical protein
MTIRGAGTGIVLCAGFFLHPGEVQAAAFDVPGTHATLQLAVAAAGASADVDNVITISASPQNLTTPVSLGAAFGPGRHLVIRPAAPLVRASLVNTVPNVVVLAMASTGYVTIQDLDIVRNITNNEDIVTMDLCEEVVIERCRIGSNWTTPGAAGWACVRITYPTEVILRNNIAFARSPGTFDYGFWAGNFNDPANSLRLYNNTVSDYRIYGIRIEAAMPGALVLLRNNVAVNYANLNPEPIGYRTEVAGGGPTVVTSHNTAFASAGFVQTGAGGAQDIAGFASSFLTFAKGDALFAFTTRLWTSAPPWDANANLYRLVVGGPLHDDAADWGMTVATAFDDIAVVDDIERQFRPGGAPPHADRGPDQVEFSSTSGVVERPLGGGLRASARLTGDRATLEYAAPAGGRLELVVVDAAGRLRHGTAHELGAAGAGRFEWPVSGHAPLFYRLTLRMDDGHALTTTGRINR